MESAITALIVIGVMILGMVTIAERSLSAQAVVSQAAQTMQERESDRARTNLAVLGASSNDAGDTVQVTLKNAGLTKMSDFGEWDVILEYSDGTNNYTIWYPNGNGAGSWHEDIYQAAPSVPETLNPGIFDPGEEMVVTVELTATVGTGTSNVASVSTPNGITATSVFTH